MKKTLFILALLSFTFSFAQVEEEVEIKEVTDEVPFAVIEKVPVYPGCDKTKSNQELKACMTKSISNHVSRRFNIQLGDSLGLKGRQRIVAAFKINKEGKVVGIRARAQHPALEKEAVRVLELLPTMTSPGYQKGKPVIVPYSLPIMFQIKDDVKQLTKKERRRLRKEALKKKVNN